MCIPEFIPNLNTHKKLGCFNFYNFGAQFGFIFGCVISAVLGQYVKFKELLTVIFSFLLLLYTSISSASYKGYDFNGGATGSLCKQTTFVLWLYGLLVGACYIMIFSECIYQEAILSKNSKLALSITMSFCLSIANFLMTIFSTQKDIYNNPDTVVGFGIVFGVISVILFGIIAFLWYKKNPNAL